MELSEASVINRHLDLSSGNPALLTSCGDHDPSLGDTDFSQYRCSTWIPWTPVLLPLDSNPRRGLAASQNEVTGAPPLCTANCALQHPRGSHPLFLLVITTFLPGDVGVLLDPFRQLPAVLFLYVYVMVFGPCGIPQKWNLWLSANTSSQYCTPHVL